ncbi:MAG: SAM-dependent methyltransferase, partial [Candidatus Omnitrophota bacterium]
MSGGIDIMGPSFISAAQEGQVVVSSPLSGDLIDKNIVIDNYRKEEDFTISKLPEEVIQSSAVFPVFSSSSPLAKSKIVDLKERTATTQRNLNFKELFKRFRISLSEIGIGLRDIIPRPRLLAIIALVAISLSFLEFSISVDRDLRYLTSPEVTLFENQFYKRTEGKRLYKEYLQALSKEKFRALRDLMRKFEEKLSRHDKSVLIEWQNADVSSLVHSVKKGSFDDYNKLSDDEKIILDAVKVASRDDPWGIFRYANDFKYLPGAIEIIEATSKDYSKFAIDNYSRVFRILEASQDEAIKTICSIAKSSYSTEQKLAISSLLHDIVFNGLTPEEAMNISNDPQRYFSALIVIKSQPNHLAGPTVDGELKDIALRKVREINDLHEMQDDVRFASVESLDARELYTLITYGEEEIFTSSFNGLFNRMMGKLSKSNTSGTDFFASVGYNKFRNFINLAANFGRLGQFLKTNEPDANKQLLDKFIQGLDKEIDMLPQAVTIADAFVSIQDNDILKVLQETIQKEYARVNNEGNREAVNIYGLLSGMFGKNAVIDAEWFKQMQDKYRLKYVVDLPADSLFNRQGKNIQQYFFYDDRADKIWDGHLSFRSFLNSYGVDVVWDKEGNITSITQKQANNWKIEVTPEYVVIKSVHPNRIEIYANRPDKQDEGQEAIKGIFKDKSLSPQVIVHRGHSFHVPKTIPQIPSSAQIVWLGSCGGYQNVSPILNRSPNASIISTKGTGTMLVNDPLLRMLNQEILNNSSVNWPSFWQKAQNKLSDQEDFRRYVPPHKNLGVLFIKAYNRLLEDSSSGTQQQEETGASSPVSSSPVQSSITEVLQDAITKGDGKIPTAEFMKLALYDPDYGYYTTQASINWGLDFSTAAEDPMFGVDIARQMHQMWELMGKTRKFTIVETGAGNGDLAKSIIRHLRAKSSYRDFYDALEYVIVDVSPSLKLEQQGNLSDFTDKVKWVQGNAFDLSQLKDIEGVFLSNELPDAFPVHRVRAGENNSFQEVYVTFKDGQFQDQLGDISDPKITDYINSLIRQGVEFAEGTEI